MLIIAFLELHGPESIKSVFLLIHLLTKRPFFTIIFIRLTFRCPKLSRHLTWSKRLDINFEPDSALNENLTLIFQICF